MMRTTIALLVFWALPLQAQGQDWPVWGGDAGGQKFSPLTQIDRSNVAGLEVAWTWETGEKAIPGPRQPIPGQDVRPGSFEATPVVINDTMYLSTPYNKVVALDANTGKEIWVFDPDIIAWGRPPNGTGLVHRGVAVWSGAGERRIFMNARWRLIALDAATGQPIESFGKGGEIDITEDLVWPTNRLHFTQTSAPVIWGDLVIIGNGTGDRLVYRNDPPGTMQAFNVHTGERVWRFDLIPQQGGVGNETWENDSWRYTGHTNVWAPFTVDEARGLLYLPVGTPSNDYYGGHRLGDNLFAETLLVLDARTGKRVWHFQTVRHGLWDYDAPGPPALLTIQVGGRRIDAVAVAGKTGFLYTFDRVTGEPVWPIEDRPVPQSDVPGERASPTQPFPTRPAPFSTIGFTEDDVIDFTPELRARALQEISKYRYGDAFIPPSLQGSIIMPGILGGANWGGPAVDPRTGVLYVKSSESPSLLKIAEADPAELEGDYDLDRSVRGMNVGGLPIGKPPYGALTAIDMNTGEHIWRVPVGDMPNVRFHPALRGVELPRRLGAIGATGPIVTAGDLVFVSGGSTALYAMDARTGEELWGHDLGNRSNANPMTYQTRAGRQYVVIAVGSGDDTRLMAFALPRSNASAQGVER